MAGDNAILTNPFGSMGGFTSMVQEIETAAPRLFPIDADKILGVGQTHMELHMTLPEGWRVQSPPNVNASSAFGEHHSEYAQSGREFVLSRTIVGAAGTYPPDQLKTMLQWMRDVAKDDAKLIVIEKPVSRTGGQ